MNFFIEFINNCSNIASQRVRRIASSRMEQELWTPTEQGQLNKFTTNRKENLKY